MNNVIAILWQIMRSYSKILEREREDDLERILKTCQENELPESIRKITRNYKSFIVYNEVKDSIIVK